MRNLLAFLALAALTFGGLGWYLDWYHVSSTPAAGGHRSVNIDVNSVKIVEDVHKGVEKGEEKLQNALEKGQKEAKAKAAEVKSNEKDKRAETNPAKPASPE